MQSALWRILTLAFLVGLFALPGLTLNPFHPDHAVAATSAASQEHPAKPKRSRTSPVHLSPTALGLTTIQNFRTASSPGLTRLVLDLDAKARPSKHPQTPGRGGNHRNSQHYFEVYPPRQNLQLVGLPNRLSLPSHLNDLLRSLSQLVHFKSYKLLTLANPHRLVIDVVPSSESLTAPPVESTPGLVLPLPTPPQPAQPRAKSFQDHRDRSRARRERPWGTWAAWDGRKRHYAEGRVETAQSLERAAGSPRPYDP